MIKILFVCLGNICRSPMAEGIFRHKLSQLGLDSKISCDSAGTASYHIGSLPDKRTMQVCEENGMKLTHLARAFTKEDYFSFDYIVAMDGQNKRDIQELEPGTAKARVVLMNDFDKPGDVPDPYYGGMDGFYNIYKMLDCSASRFIEHLVRTHEL